MALHYYSRRDFLRTASFAATAPLFLTHTFPMPDMTPTDERFDAILIGGSFSGLSAALALARARLRVLVIDTNEPCNARVPHAHNLLTHDGEPPQLIHAKARADVARYATVQWSDRRVVHATGTDGDFVVRTDDGTEHRGRKLLLALGVRDALPAIPGFAACWGISAAACPFCHGYEVADRPIAVLGNGPDVVEYARLIRQWSRSIVLLTNGPADLPAEQRALLDALSITVEETPVERVDQEEGRVTGIVLNDERSISAAALFARLSTSTPIAFAADLGCALTDHGLLQVDPMQRTTVPGVFASGDCASPMRSLSMAIATGSMAGAAIVHELVRA